MQKKSTFFFSFPRLSNFGEAKLLKNRSRTKSKYQNLLLHSEKCKNVKRKLLLFGN